MRILPAVAAAIIGLSFASTAFAQEQFVTTVQDTYQPNLACMQARRDAQIKDGFVGGIIGALAGRGLGKHGGRAGGTLLGALAGAGTGTAIGTNSQLCSDTTQFETVTTRVVETPQCAPVTERFTDPSGVSHTRTIEMCKAADGNWRVS